MVFRTEIVSDIEQKKLKKLLILTARFPYPLEKGDKLRIYYQMKELSNRYEIILCSLTEGPINIQDYQEVKKYASRIYTFNRPKVMLVRNLASAFYKGLPLQLGYFFDKSVKKDIHEIIAKEKPAHIFCQLIRMAEYVRDVDVPKTIDYMDTFSIAAKRWAKTANKLLRPIIRREAAKLVAYEAQVFDDFDKHTIISEQDRNYLEIEKKDTIKIVPNGVDMAFFKPNPSIKKEYDIAFVGNMGYVPNVEGARYLVQEILPILIKKNPNIKILIAGARPTALVQSLAGKNVTITGWVEDIRTAYASSKIFVAPLFLGSGLQNKILESMSMSVPCITTTLVNNAVKAIPNKDIVIADDEDTFAYQILKLLEDAQRIEQIGKNGIEFIKANYSWSSYVDDLIDCFESE